MRLIDADDFLKREIQRCGCVPLIGSCTADNEIFKFVLEQQPTVDAVEVVRCKDCIFYFEGFMAKPTCRLQDKFMVVEANHYCSYGKKVAVMCDIAPFQMECINDEYKHALISCAECHLHQAFNNLLKEIPIIGDLIPEYHCQGFEVKKEVKKNDTTANDQ